VDCCEQGKDGLQVLGMQLPFPNGVRGLHIYAAKNFNANGSVVTVRTLPAQINFNGTQIPTTPSGENSPLNPKFHTQI
jgi:hypothetical protein